MKDHRPLQEQAEEIYKHYEGLSLQEKIDVISMLLTAIMRITQLSLWKQRRVSVSTA